MSICDRKYIRKKNAARKGIHDLSIGDRVIPDTTCIKCSSGKLQFKSRKKAKQYIKKLNLSNSVYKCFVCNQFHTTSCGMDEKLKIRPILRCVCNV